MGKKNIRSIRPGFGMHPKFYKEVLGKKALENMEKGDLLNSDFIKK